MLLKNRTLIFTIIIAINIVLLAYFTITSTYPLAAIAINSISILVLLISIIPSRALLRINVERRIDIIIFAILVFLGACVYLYQIDVVTPGMQLDEITIAQASEDLSRQSLTPFIQTNYGHATPLLYITSMSIDVFGRTIYAIRLPYALLGAFTIGAFYILLRLFVRRSIAISTVLVMLCSYSMLIVSRLAYEVTPMLLFETLSILCLTLAWKKQELRYYLMLGLCLGAGLYTYVGFRLFALVILGLALYLIFKTHKSLNSRRKFCSVLIGSFFVISVPILSYTLIHPDHIMARVNSLSPLGQGFTSTEVFNEILANIGRLSHLFFMGDPATALNGDTNYARNPANISIFDFGTFLLFILGMYFLYRSNKNLFLIVGLLALVAVVSDILVIERIPEAPHPLGVGHPNILRIAGIIPVIYFVIAYGLNRIRQAADRVDAAPLFACTYIFLGVIILYNVSQYFTQPPDTKYGTYIQSVNGVGPLTIVDLINQRHAENVAIAPVYSADARFQYFLQDSDINITNYSPNTVEEAMRIARLHDLAVIDAGKHPDIVINILSEQPPVGFDIKMLSVSPRDPNHTVYALVLIKNK